MKKMQLSVHITEYSARAKWLINEMQSIKPTTIMGHNFSGDILKVAQN